MALRLSDFETEDQASLAKPPVQSQPPKTLLDFANQQHYKITSGYSPGTGHTKGSMHYQGNAKDPGAIDIDHKGVDYNKLVAAANANGYNVLDEVRHPSAASTGPHYHISKARNGSMPAQAAAGQPKPKEISSQPNSLIAPFDVNSLQMPTTTDANGNFVVNQGKPQRNIGAEIGKAVKPEPKRQVSESISLSDFDLDQNDQAEIQAIAERLKPQPKPQTAPVTAQAKIPGLLEGLVDMGKGAIEGLRKEVLPTTEEIRASAPHSIQEAIYNAGVRDNPYAQISAGALSEGANFVNGVTDLVGLGKPIPTGGLQRFTENHPVYSTIGRAAPYALGEAGLAKAGMKVAPGITKALTANPLSRIATGAGVNAAEGYLVDPGEAGQQGRVQNAALSGLIGGGAHGVGEMLGGSHAQKPQPKEIGAPKTATSTKDFKAQADIIQNLRNLDNADKVKQAAQDVQGGLRPVANPEPVNTKELTQSFRARGGELPNTQPQGNLNVKILGADGNPTPKVAGSGINKSPYDIALERTRPPEAPVNNATRPLKVVRDIPSREITGPSSVIDPLTGRPYPDAPSKYAERSASVLDAAQSDLDEATRIHSEAQAKQEASTKTLQELTGANDLAEAQQRAGRRINELQQSSAPTPEESARLSELQAALHDLHQSTRDVSDAGKLLDEVQATSSRSELPAPKAQPPEAPTPISREIANKASVEQIQKPKRAVSKELPSIYESTPRKTLQLLDASGKPMSREIGTPTIERPGQPRPTDPAALELPKNYEKPQLREVGQVEPKALETGTTKGNIHKTPEGGTVYTQGRDPANVEQLVKSLGNQSQIIELEAAKRLLAQKKTSNLLSPEEFQKQTDVLNLFEEAGRSGKSFQAMRREIQEGEGRISQELGKAQVKNRDSLAPFAITVRQRKPSTEVSNLVKKLGSIEQARASLQQTAGKYGITPTTAGRTQRANAVKIAEQIASHPKGKLEFSDIYLNAHNFKTGGVKTATDAPRGYPLRTFEGANIGAEAANIPQGALNQNAISQQFGALEQLKNAPDIAPEVKQIVTKVADNPNASFKDIRKMRESIQESLQSFCNIWGLK